MSQPKTTAEPDVKRSKREDILDAAGSIFLQHGFEAATTLEIARRARTSKRALYEQFGSKQAILTALIATTSQRMKAPLELPLPQTQQAFYETLRQFGSGFLLEFLHPHRIGMYRLAISQAGRSEAVGQALDQSGRGPVAAAAIRLFSHAAEKGFVKGSAAELVDTFFSVLIGQLHIRLLLGLEPTATADMIQQRTGLAISVIKRLAQYRQE